MNERFWRYAWRWVAMVAWLWATPLWADVQLEVDRQRLTEGETVTLTFFTDDPGQKLDTDFSPLEADFAILDRRSETQLSIVNGRQTALVRLVLTVEPRRTGALTIPPLAFGKEQTRSFTLQVDPAPQLAPGELPPVFLEVEITPEEGPYYVHAQLGLVVRVFYQQNLTEAAISQPEPSPASVRLLQETPYQAERGGERYRVLERRYAVFPERSGELVLPAMQLSGRLVERRNSGVWQPNVRGRRVAVESEPLTVPIEPRPAEFSGAEWQPARELNLAQQISATDSLQVGEPVTRTVIVDTVGLEDNMIAEPAWPAIEGARIYPDQPQGISRDDGQWVLGHKEFRYAVVPEREGKLVLPELRVDWWDTREHRQRTAVLPARVLEVLPSAPIVPPPEAPSPGGVAEPGGPVAVASGAGYWRWLALGFAALWLVTLGLAARLWTDGGRRATRSQRARPEPGDEAAWLKEFRDACRANDAARTRRSLQGWSRRYGPRQGGSVLELAADCGDARLAAAIRGLDRQGFGHGADGDWQGEELWRAFEAWRRAQQAGPGPEQPEPTDLYAPANRVP